MFEYWIYMIVLLFGVFFVPVTAGFCEGGHICSSPRECCREGCCPPYQTGPRKLTPATDHVLNLFFISHWYFWCVVVAILLAVLCAYSLWKKRRQLCGWNNSDHHAQSEGDSTGSCYAPPQYSRCNSFRHPPPPYGEVTSKPDLYPLVFTCNTDNNKSGGSYLMVQYFRNLIVRPVGSLSAASTVDSLSSSFICNANEANLLVPPPYSRAASPEIGIHSHFMLPRSASQLVCPTNCLQPQLMSTNFINNNNNNNGNIVHTPLIISSPSSLEQQRGSDTNIHYYPTVSNRNKQSNGIVTSHSDQQLKFITNNSSSNNISDVFIDNSCSNNSVSNGLINNNNNNNNLNNKIITTTQIINNGERISTRQNSSSVIYNSSGSINDDSGDMTNATINIIPRTDLDPEYCAFRRNLEKFQLMQKPFNGHQLSVDLIKRYDGGGGVGGGGLQSFLNSNTCSIVSSLANINSPNSPPQATSPTSEIILDNLASTENQASQQIIMQNDNSINLDLEDKIVDISNSRGNNRNTTTTQQQQHNISLQNKKKIFSKSNKSMYIPITNNLNNSNSKSIKSPVTAASYFIKNRGKRSYNSKSAPTTPGCIPNFIGDDNSPLLNEYEEDAEYNA